MYFHLSSLQQTKTNLVLVASIIIINKFLNIIKINYAKNFTNVSVSHSKIAVIIIIVIIKQMIIN